MIKSLAELDKIKKECQALVTKRAAVSGVAAVIPLPGTDVTADIGMLMELLPEINRRFELSEADIALLDDKTKILLVQASKKAGGMFVGKTVTRELIVQILKKISARLAAKQVIKYIPFFGQVTAVAISFAAMKYVGNSHINECYAVARKLLEAQKMRPQAKEAAQIWPEDSKAAKHTGGSREATLDNLRFLQKLFEEGVIAEKEFLAKKKELLDKLQ